MGNVESLEGLDPRSLNSSQTIPSSITTATSSSTTTTSSSSSTTSSKFSLSPTLSSSPSSSSSSDDFVGCFGMIQGGHRQALLEKFQYFADVVYKDSSDEEAPVSKKTEEGEQRQSPSPQSQSQAKNLVSELLSETLCSKVSVTSKAGESLTTFLEEISDWILVEANRFAEEEDPKNPIISSENVVQAVQSLLSVPTYGIRAGANAPVGEERKKGQDFCMYYLAVEQCIRNFFDLLTFANWKILKDKSNLHILCHETVDPGLLCLRGTTTISASPGVILETILDLRRAKQWDLFLQESTLIEEIDERTKIVHLKYLGERCLLREGRDFVVLCHWFKRPVDNSICVVIQSVDHPRCMPEAGYVRGKVICSGFWIMPLDEQEGKNTKKEAKQGEEQGKGKDEKEKGKEESQEGEEGKGLQEEKKENEKNWDGGSEKEIKGCRVTQLVAVHLGKMPPFLVETIVQMEPISLHRLRNHIHTKKLDFWRKSN